MAKSQIKRLYSKGLAFYHNLRTDIYVRRRINYWNEIVEEHLQRIKQPELSVQEKQEIDRFWLRYGIKIKDYRWYQWYYGYTGMKDPRLIPQDIMQNIVIPYYNVRKFESAYKNKCLFDVFLPDCNFPKTILKRINGSFYDSEMRNLDEKEVVQLIAKHKEIIVKNAVETGQGKNVKKYPVGCENDVISILSSWKEKNNYVVQEVIKQHPFFAQFNDSSVNIIRFNSLCVNGKVYIHTPVLRFGLPGYATDCAHVDGEEVVRFVGISDCGEIKDTVIHLNGDQTPVSELIQNPITKVPSFDKILKMIEENAKKLPYQGIIGWDITVDELCNPVVIEYNINMPSPYSSQVTGGPMWGDDTERLLSFLELKDDQRKYIPSYYRAHR